MTTLIPTSTKNTNSLFWPERRALADGTSGWYEAAKPRLDRLLALTALVLAAPVLLLAAIAVKLTSRGPVLYSQLRLGQFGRPFRIYKLRSMVHDCERLTGAKWCLPGDPRVTPIGRLLRKAHIDELPQLWNILKGEMGLVGPRPERPEFVPQLEQAIPHYRDRLAVRPGVTGLAQIFLPPDTDLASVRRKLAYDLVYIRQVNPWLDLRILTCTALYLLGVPFAISRRLFRLPRPDGEVQSPKSKLQTQETRGLGVCQLEALNLEL